MKLSLVVPCYNEQDNVTAFRDAVLTAFQNCGYEYEIIFVDDGSSDNTYARLKELFAEKKCAMKAIRFSRNFGKESAIYAGIEASSGEYISLIDADLQQRPEIVRQMVCILDEQPEYDIVAAYQDRRGEGKVLSFFKKGFYKLINRLSDVNLRSDASDFRTFRRTVANSILSMGEFHRFSKGIFAWVGFETCFIPYTAQPRMAGKSKWSFRKLFHYAIEGIVGYSTKPLHIATFLGSCSAASAFLYLIYVVLKTLITGVEIPGYATIIVLILFLGGMQLFAIGIIGEYIGKIFEQSKNRPVYITKETLSYEDE